MLKKVQRWKTNIVHKKNVNCSFEVIEPVYLMFKKDQQNVINPPGDVFGGLKPVEFASLFRRNEETRRRI